MQLNRTIHFHLHTPLLDGAPVNIAGTFNDWNQNEYPMHLDHPGHYSLSINIPWDDAHPIEYKFLRGTWENVELDEYGGGVSNRLMIDPQEPVNAYVPRWRNHGLTCDAGMMPLIQFHSVKLPRSRKERRVSVLLPYDYHQSHKRYPVLYLMDGQNLFEDGAPFGSWSIHKRLAVLAEKHKHEIIIVAIDHAGVKRVEEYSYINNTAMDSNRGHQFLDWITVKLKPMIDGEYRTLEDQSHTGIGGSSMGGLISLLAGTVYPHVFGKLMIFSPSLWKIVHLLYDRTMYLPLVSNNQSIYLYAGGREAGNMKGFTEDFFKRLNEFSTSDHHQYHYTFNERGKHNEKYWGSEFPRALKFLFF